MPVVIGGNDTQETAEYGEVTLQAGFSPDFAAGTGAGAKAGAKQGLALGVECAAVAIRFRGELLRNQTGLQTWIKVKELRVYGTPSNRVQINVTGTYPPASADEFYAPEIAAIVSDNNFGEPRILQINAGNSTEVEARAIGRLALRRMQLWQTRRTYTIKEFEAVPQLGQTMQMPDDFTGVVWECTYKCDAGGQESLSVVLVNLNA